MITVSTEDAYDGTLGVCIECGNIQSGVEPDAENYECEVCEKHTVYGVEQAVLLGLIDLEDE